MYPEAPAKASEKLRTTMDFFFVFYPPLPVAHHTVPPRIPYLSTHCSNHWQSYPSFHAIPCQRTQRQPHIHIRKSLGPVCLSSEVLHALRSIFCTTLPSSPTHTHTYIHDILFRPPTILDNRQGSPFSLGWDRHSPRHRQPAVPRRRARHWCTVCGRRGTSRRWGCRFGRSRSCGTPSPGPHQRRPPRGIRRSLCDT